MSAFLIYRPRIQSDGLLRLRALKLPQVLAILVNLLGLIPRLRAAAPAWGQLALDELLAEAQTVHDLLVAEAVAAGAPIQVPQELLDMLALLRRADDLTSPREVNYLLDHLISALALRVQSYAHGLDFDERRDAALRLEALWFAQGRAFLQAESTLQWAETHRYFARPSTQTRKDLKLLRLEQTHAFILAFNAWFARLLGIDPNLDIDPNATPDPEPAPYSPPEPPPRAPMDRADELLCRAFQLFNVLWPSRTDPAQIALRAAAQKTLLEHLQARH